MDSEDVGRAISLMERHGIAAFDYESGATELRLRLGAGLQQTGPSEKAPAQVQQAMTHLSSPSVGIFQPGHPAVSTFPVPLPRKAAKGEIVGYIKTGLTLRAVVATGDCILRRALVPQGQGVGHGEALFEIAPA